MHCKGGSLHSRNEWNNLAACSWDWQWDWALAFFFFLQFPTALYLHFNHGRVLGPPQQSTSLYFIVVRQTTWRACPSKHVCRLIFIFKPLGKCEGVISASLSGSVGTCTPSLYGWSRKMIKTQRTVALTPVLGGQIVTSIEESNGDKPGIEDKIQTIETLTQKWLDRISPGKQSETWCSLRVW